MSESPEPIDESTELPAAADEIPIELETPAVPAPEMFAAQTETEPELLLPAVAELTAAGSESKVMNATPEEVVAAKWYTMGFLVAIGLLSLIGLIVLIRIAVHAIGVVLN